MRNEIFLKVFLKVPSYQDQGKGEGSLIPACQIPNSEVSECFRNVSVAFYWTLFSGDNISFRVKLNLKCVVTSKYQSVLFGMFSPLK